MDTCIIKLINRMVGTLHKNKCVTKKTKKNTSLHFYSYKLQNDFNLKKIKENKGLFPSVNS